VILAEVQKRSPEGKMMKEEERSDGERVLLDSHVERWEVIWERQVDIKEERWAEGLIGRKVDKY
jgi:hypothetical protein